MFKKMKWWLSILFISNCLLLTGCNMLSSGKDVTTDSLSEIKLKSGPVFVNQNLPVKKLTVNSSNGSHEFDVEVATSKEEQRVGLMNKLHLDENKGMLFVFNRSGLVDFWMKDTLIELDMLFINESRVVEHIARNVKPCQKDPCPLYNSQKVVRYVLEIGGGVADKMRIKEGDKIGW